MSDIIRKLDEEIKSLTSGSAKMANVDKESLHIYIDAISKDLGMFVHSFNFSNDELQMFKEKLENNKQNTAMTGVISYWLYKRAIAGVAAKQEENSPFSSLVSAAKIFVEVLDQLDRKLEELFQNKTITLYNTKLSQVVLFGVLIEARTVSNFCLYLLSAVVAEITGAVPPSAKYRLLYLTENAPAVGDIVNHVTQRSGAFSFLVSVDQLKKNNSDIYIVAEDDQSNAGMIKYNSTSISTNRLIVSGIGGLNIFRWLGERWNNLKHATYQRQVNTKEWMETQVALLKQELAGKDPNDPEYVRLAKIVKNYDDLINDADKKINDYLGTK